MTVSRSGRRMVVVARWNSNNAVGPILAVWLVLLLLLLCYCSSGVDCFVSRSITTTTKLMMTTNRRSKISSMSMSFQESGISSMSSQSTNSQQTQPKPVVTIRVCSGADCRVDGSTDCLRMIQNQCKQKLATLGRSNDDSSSQQQQQLRDQIKIKSVQCLGPCGDGPNVVLNLSLQGGENDDRFGKRVVNRELQDILKETNQKGSGGGPKSLVPAEPFGANTSGVYQVRTTQNAATIVNLAVQTLSKEGGVGEEAPLRSLIEDESKMSSKNEHVTVTRQWYDRPRNERLVLQRFMHVSILFGLGSKYNDEGGVLPSSAWIIAGILWILSNLIMKENLLEQGWNKINRKKR